MQDLIRGIKKIIGANAPKEPVKEPVAVGGGSVNIAPLLKRVLMFLEDGNWRDADEYCEKVLDQDPENPQAYLGKLMAELKVRKQDDLQNCDKPFDGSNNYQKVLRFAEPTLADQMRGYISFINERNELARLNGIYNRATQAMQNADTESKYQSAATIFQTIPGFKDADTLAKQCLEQAEICRKDAIYNSATKSAESGSISGYESAISTFQTIPGWRDADEQIEICKKKIEEIEAKAEADRKDAIYNSAKRSTESGLISGYESAISTFQTIPGWRDADEQIEICKKKIEEIEAKAEADRIEAQRKAEERRIKTIKKRIRIAIVTSIVCVCVAFCIVLKTVILPQMQYKSQYKSAEELLANGQIVEAALSFGQISGFSDANDRSLDLWDQVAVRSSLFAGSNHTVGLEQDGTVVAVGENEYGQCNVSGWTDIIAVSAGDSHTVGLKATGTVVAIGNNKYGQCAVYTWADIVSVSTGSDHTVGLKADGTVVATGLNNQGQCNVSDWTDIIAISAGNSHTVGLKSDGTVVAVGLNYHSSCDVSDWADIVAISASNSHTVGLKSDGTVVAVGSNSSGQCNVTNWTNIVAISAGDGYTVGLKADGTVVAVGSNKYGQCDVSNWTDIVAISAGNNYTVGLKSDGTVVAVGNNKSGQCNVEDWTDIKVPD
jgi:tetratricopeptide (TPR) repeat protein